MACRGVPAGTGLGCCGGLPACLPSCLPAVGMLDRPGWVGLGAVGLGWPASTVRAYRHTREREGSGVRGVGGAWRGVAGSFIEPSPLASLECDSVQGHGHGQGQHERLAVHRKFKFKSSGRPMARRPAGTPKHRQTMSKLYYQQRMNDAVLKSCLWPFLTDTT